MEKIITLVLCCIIVLLSIVLAVMLSKNRKLKRRILIRQINTKRETLPFEIAYDCQFGSRSIQQDYIVVKDRFTSQMYLDAFAILCDGMGGLELGEEASSTVAKDVRDLLTTVERDDQIIPTLKYAAEFVSKKLFDMSKEKGLQSGMGTTLLVVVLHKGCLYWVSIGDSRLYLYRDSKLIVLNEKHDYMKLRYSNIIEDEVEIGVVLNDPNNLRLSSYVGQETPLFVDQNKIPLRLNPHDRIFLCSDGVYNVLNEKELISLFQLDSNKLIKQIVDEVVKKNNPNQDNFSLILVTYLDEEKGE